MITRLFLNDLGLPFKGNIASDFFVLILFLQKIPLKLYLKWYKNENFPQEMKH